CATAGSTSPPARTPSSSSRCTAGAARGARRSSSRRSTPRGIPARSRAPCSASGAAAPWRSTPPAAG
ncbi:MAG: hypothetical protein AVDCRST_MAG13-1227, partial [uncultured Solirubrobacteraceae bacterium]